LSGPANKNGAEAGRLSLQIKEKDMNGTRSLGLLTVVALGVTACGASESLTLTPSEFRGDAIAVNGLKPPVRTTGLDLSPSAITFSAVEGAARPPSQTVGVTSLANGKLVNLSAGPIAYGAGASGWLTATLSDTRTPAVLTLVAASGALAAGTYTATVPVTAPKGGSPQSVTVTLAVTNAGEGPLTGLFDGSYDYGHMSMDITQIGSIVTARVTDTLGCQYTATGTLSGLTLVLDFGGPCGDTMPQVHLTATVDANFNQITGSGSTTYPSTGPIPWSVSMTRVVD
jgi:hypothetical protein